MKLTHLQCQLLHTALSKLDSCKFPKSANGAMRYNIAKNLRLLRPALDVFEDTRVSLVQSITNGKGAVDPQSPEGVAYFMDLRELQKKEAGDFELLKLKWDTLDPETNAIAPSTLADLEPVLDGALAD